MGRASVVVLLAGLLAFSVASFPQNSAPVSPPQVRRIEPPSPTATAGELERRADELRLEKAYPDAMTYYQAALKKTPTDVLYNKAGICELQMMHLPEAKKYFEKAIKLNSGYAEAHNNLGVVFYSQKKNNKAIREYMKALRLNDDSASFHANLGSAYMARKEFDKMAAEYSRALELDPMVFEHRSGAGVSLQLGKPEERAQYSFLVAKVYAKLGNSDQSLHYLREAMEEGYKDINVVYKDADFAALRKDPRFAELMTQRPPAIPQ